MPFLSMLYPWRQRKLTLGERINVMTQALQVEDGSLPQCLTVQNVYAELRTGSKNAVEVVRNSTAYPQTLKKKTPVAWVVVATMVPELLVMINLPEGVEELHSPQTPKLTLRQRQEKLFEELDLSALASWPPEQVDSAWLLLAEYHDVFSLESSELGCTHSTEHMIKVTNNSPFKEQFRQIPPPLVEDVHSHLQEMLDSDTIQPNQSVWCNAVVLVRKKGGGLCFCIDFCCLNTHTKKDSYPLLRIQDGVRESGRCWSFFLPGPKAWLLAN